MHSYKSLKNYYLVSTVRQQASYRPLSILKISSIDALKYNQEIMKRSLDLRLVDGTMYRDFVAGMVFPA